MKTYTKRESVNLNCGEKDKWKSKHSEIEAKGVLFVVVSRGAKNPLTTL